MTDLQRLELRAAAVRRELAKLATAQEPTEEELATMDTLRSEYVTLDQRMASLTIAGDEPEAPSDDADNGDGDGETRSDPLEELIARANAGIIAQAAIEQRSTEGAERELQQEVGLQDHQIPVEMLMERRADANPTGVPGAGSRQANQAPIVPFVFPDGVAAFLGVAQPTVPVGDRVYAVLTKAATVGTPAKNADQATAALTFSAKTLSPARIQAALSYAIEDAAVFPGVDMALRANIREALSDQLDKQVIGNLLADGQAVDATGAVVSFATSVKELYAAVDGRYASTAGAVRIVVGSATFQLLANAYRGTGTNETALQKLMADSGGVRVNANMPAAASKKQKSIFRVGRRMDAVAPIWQGITLIPDRITQASAGQMLLTAVMLYAVDTLRSAPIRVVEFQTAA